MDMFLALTNDDEDNIMSATLAKRLGCKRVVALINRRAYAEMVQGGPIDIVAILAGPGIHRLLCSRTSARRCRRVQPALGRPRALEVVVHGDAKNVEGDRPQHQRDPRPKGVTVARSSATSTRLRVIYLRRGHTPASAATARSSSPTMTQSSRRKTRVIVLRAQETGAQGRAAVPGRVRFHLKAGI